MNIRVDEALWASRMLPEGVVENWIAADGSRITAGDHIADVRIEGAVHRITAPADGRLHITLHAKSLIEPGSVLGDISGS